MFNLVARITGIAVASFAFASPVGALAGEQPNLLIVGEDADLDTVPRNSRVFNRVLLAISSEMQLEGFKVFDETAVSLDITNPKRVRRDDAELITVARRVQDVPVDAITVFQIYASAEKNAYADIVDLRVRVPGRLINVSTGQSLGNYEVSYGPRDLPPLPANCNRDCILEHVGDQAKRIAADVGAVLATKLDNVSPASAKSDASINITVREEADTDVAPAVGSGPTADCTGLTSAYKITFRGFETSEVSQIEEYLVAFKGYDHHRPVRVGRTEAEYWYESCSDVARLNRNLRLMAEHMGVDARIGMAGNRFEVDKIEAPKTR